MATTKKPVARAEPEPEDHEHAHDHDGHDHDGHDHEELTPEQEAEAEADVARMAQALAAIDDEILRDALAHMSEKSRLDVAAQLQLPRATMRLGDALLPLVRRKLVTAGADHQLQVLFALAERVNDETIAALGDKAEEPSRADLDAVLPDVLDHHPTPIVTLMLAGYAASDAPCRPVMREILESDERFVIGPPIEVDDRGSSLLAAPPKIDKLALEAKREQRRAAKDAKRAAELRTKEAKATAQAKRRAALHQSKRKSH